MYNKITQTDIAALQDYGVDIIDDIALGLSSYVNAKPNALSGCYRKYWKKEIKKNCSGGVFDEK